MRPKEERREYGARKQSGYSPLIPGKPHTIWTSQLRGNVYRRGSRLVSGKRCNGDEVSRLQVSEPEGDTFIRLRSQIHVGRIGGGVCKFRQELLHLFFIRIRVFWCSPFVQNRIRVDCKRCGWCRLPAEYSGLDGHRIGT